MKRRLAGALFLNMPKTPRIKFLINFSPIFGEHEICVCQTFDASQALKNREAKGNSVQTDQLV
jgi:hypothetical protein